MQDRLTHQYQKLIARAHQRCNNALYEQALAIYRQCLVVAQELQDDDKIAGSRSWIGECLRKLDRQAEALIVLAPNLSKYAKGNPKEIYNSMTTYLGIALELPARRELIADAINEARAYLYRIGRIQWQHSLLLLEAIFLEEQGLWEEAIDSSERSWSIWQQKYPYFTADSHFYQRTLSKIRLNRLDDARQIVEDWGRNQSDTHPTTRVSQMSQALSLINRREGNFQASIRYANRAVTFATQLEVPRDLAATLIALTWAHMLAGDLEAAKQTILQIPRPILRHKKAFILGDYHLSRARSLCGLPLIDMTYEHSFPELPSRIQGTAEICHDLQLARMFYQMALKRAQHCDEAFNSTWRQNKLHTCIVEVDALEKAIEVPNVN